MVLKRFSMYNHSEATHRKINTTCGAHTLEKITISGTQNMTSVKMIQAMLTTEDIRLNCLQEASSSLSGESYLGMMNL